jgi:hypothetical protein
MSRKSQSSLKKKPHGEDPDGLCITSERIATAGVGHTPTTDTITGMQSGLLGCNAKEIGMDIGKERNISRIIWP